VGAGHAGIEAALAAARRGKKTLVVTLCLNSIGFLACNPNIGGTAKAQLVKEIDALGGYIGEAADKATIQIRMLNASSGPAVQSLRAQVDKNKYHIIMKKKLEEKDNITLLESDVTDIIVENNKVKGIKTNLGDKYYCKALILTTGVFLGARIIIGEYIQNSGPSGFSRSEKLTKSLLELGLPIRRFKTGTPPRVLAKTIDFDKMQEQRGEDFLPKFSLMTDFEIKNTHKCYLTYTNEKTHEIIRKNIHRAPLYNGSIEGIGPRYCPSIEDKIFRFPDKDKHQIFIEPEGEDTLEMYVQGLSTSMPFDVQEQMMHTVRGLERARIARYGYAIEYDCLDPECLLPTMGIKGIEGLYSAGQINGSSGYEEAAAQGLMAGVNAVNYIEGMPPFILRRDEAYIGVLIDDLVTKGVNEPYRMMTSRAEYRLYLRQDNADLRLAQKGWEQGIIDEKRYKRYQEKKEKIQKLMDRLEKSYSPKEVTSVFERKNQPPPKAGVKAKDILKRVGMDIDDLIAIDPSFKDEEREILLYAQTEIKYQGYMKKQEQSIKELKRMENKEIPKDIDYDKIKGLRIEAKDKLKKIQPLTLAQAGRISGVNPADILVLMIWIEKNK
jgi:tRNA uridine 5-carboxymethylaminomethyl modification enzyme